MVIIVSIGYMFINYYLIKVSFKNSWDMYYNLALIHILFKAFQLIYFCNIVKLKFHH